MNENRSVPMARYVEYSVKGNGLSLSTFKRVLRGLNKVKSLTSEMTFEHQGRHDLLLGALGAVGLVTYAYISTHLGLPGANEVFLVAGVSGSRKSKKFKGGLVVTRNPDGTGEFSIDGIGPAGGGLTKEVTREFFSRPTRAEKLQEKLQEKLYDQSKFTRETTDWFIKKGNTLEEVAHAKDARELKH